MAGLVAVFVAASVMAGLVAAFVFDPGGSEFVDAEPRICTAPVGKLPAAFRSPAVPTTNETF
jgi:hypothetical protein